MDEPDSIDAARLAREITRTPADNTEAADVAAKFATEVGFLRSVAENLAIETTPAGEITEDFLRAEGLARARQRKDKLIVLRRSGEGAFTEL
jgi:hypothetical protein